MELLNFFDSIYKISSEAKKALERIIQEKSYAKNDIIQHIGSSCRTVYIVQSGSARIFYLKDGNDITEHFAFANDIIVRAESLFTGKSTSKGIQAMDKTIMIAIDSESLFKMYDQYHDIERLFRLIFEREYVNTIKRLESLQFKTATERYHDLLVDTDFFIQKIPLKYIATYLGYHPGFTQQNQSRDRLIIYHL